MKKHEFNPLHNHDGIYSFVIFVNIPYDLTEEENYFADVSIKESKSEIQTSKFNFELVSGDEINIPAKNKTAIISGAVQQEGVLNIDRSINAKLAVNYVGGFKNNASRKEVYVEYQNGLRKTTRNFLFFKFYPRVLPGSKVIVPEKDKNKSKTSVGEIVGYTTSLVSIIALIKSL